MENTARKLISLNSGWQFTGPNGTCQVDVPHTWNALDGQDGGNDFLRTVCTYCRRFATPSFDPAAQRVYLQFDGVNSSAAVTLNGKKVMQHNGGYSTFRADITGLLLEGGDNDLNVQVDNRANDTVYPQKADFTFYGGIYRDVTLVIVSAAHFDMDYHGGCGVKITPIVEDAAARRATLKVESRLSGVEPGDPAVTVQLTLRDAAGAQVAAGTGANQSLALTGVHLWNGTADPYLYTVELQLCRGGTVVDCISRRCGFRSFSVDAQKGFFLNGKLYPLRGVCRHQDRKGLGNAITKAMHDEDMALIKEVGANTLRLAHYQNDQYFYDLCDEAGLVVWAEIPYISEHMPGGRANTISQMQELIVQNYNHPSIVVWGVSNEITISTKDKADMLDNHRKLNELCHEMDPTRLTTLACYAMCGPFNKVAHITDLVSWNLYLGWYVPGLFLNDLWMDFFHLVYPNRPLGYSEYGAESMPNLHSAHPRRGDHTEEYQALYHEYMLRCFDKRPWLWATHVWNMFDFAADARNQGGEPGMNHKGLITFDRKTKKDSFYLYKAWWSKAPFVHICSKRFTDRTEATVTVKVYSNQPTVALYANGALVGEQTGDKIFTFSLPLTGEVALEARAGGLTDSAALRRVDTPNPAYRLQKSKSKSANWV